MKSGRLLLLSVATVVVLLLGAVGIALTSGFQTWAARRILAGRPELNVTVGRISVGLDQVTAENVRVDRAGATLTLPVVEMDLPVYAAAMHNRVFVRRLFAHGWTLDLTHARFPLPTVVARQAPVRAAEFSLLPSAYAADPSAVSPDVFAGIFSQLKLPVDLSVAGLDLAGEVLLPVIPGQPAARAKVTLRGGDLAAGHPGRFDYTAVIEFAGADAAVGELKVSGTLGVVMDTPRTFARFVAATAADATGPKLPDGVRLTIDLSAARLASGENYALAILAGAKQLAVIETSYAAGESHLRGAWRIDMHDTDVAPFGLGHELPMFEATGEGKFDVDTKFTELIASGRLNATADRLGAVWPELAVLGAVKLAADFDLAQRAAATRVDRLAVTLAGARPIATLEALQPFEFDLKTGALSVADPSKELLDVIFQGLPLAWIRPLVSKTGFVVTGNELQGELVASARDGGFTLRPKVPLLLGNLSLSLADGRPLLRHVDVSLAASADYTPRGWQLQVAPLAVTSGVGPLFALEVKAGQLAGKDQPIKVAGEWTAHLPAWLAQPVAGGALALTSGEAQGDLAASLGGKREFQFRLALTNLVGTTSGNLPALHADVRADVGTDGALTFNAPIFFDQAGQRSDLTLGGTLTPGAHGLGLSARLESNLLVLDDVKNFALPFLATWEAPAKPEGTLNGPNRAASPAAFWDEVNGSCVFTLKKVVCTEDVQVTDVGGTIRVEPETIKLVDARAMFGVDSAVRLSGAVTYGPARPREYALTANFALNNFDLATVFRALDPTKAPTVEGRVNLTSRLSGEGVTLEEMAAHTRGEVKLTGKSGIFRALSADMSERIQKAQSRVVAIGSFLGVLTDDYVNKTKILADIAKSLAEIPYDQLSLTAERDAGLNLVIRDFTLISPEVRLSGSGVVRYAADRPVLMQPMELQFSLGARGRLGDLVRRAGLLESQPDNLGYSAFSVPLKLGGTLTKPDSSAIRDALLNSALERSGLLDSLFGGRK